jgi:hypothetical protein
LQFERLGRIGSFVVIAGFAIGATAWTLEMSRRSVAFAFWINWALMGLAFVTWLVAPARFGRSYYRVHAFVRSGRLYERLGVRHFQRFLRRVGFMNPWVRYRAGPSAGATRVAATEASVTAHMLIFIMLALVSGLFVRRGWWDTAGWLFLFYIVHNAYPVLSLRSVRARADRCFASPSENGESIRRHRAGVAGTTEAAQQAAAADERGMVQTPSRDRAAVRGGAGVRS